MGEDYSAIYKIDNNQGERIARRRLLQGIAVTASLTVAPNIGIACPHAPDDPRLSASDYIDGMTGLGFELMAGPPGRWWEREPIGITPALRQREMALRACLAAVPGARGAVRDGLIRRGLVLQG